MNNPFEAHIDGKPIEKWHTYTDGKILVARVLPKNQWPYELRKELTEIVHQDGPMSYVERFDKPVPVLEEPIHLHLFVTPAADYRDLESHIDSMKDLKVKMGGIPTLRVYNQPEITAQLEHGFFYDLISTGIYRGGRILIGGGRLSTEKGEIPFDMTLDELKLLALEDLGLSPEQAQNIEAQIAPMTAWNRHGRLIIAGFGFGESKPGWNYGLMANHLGGVDHYHGYSTEQIREYLHV